MSLITVIETKLFCAVAILVMLAIFKVSVMYVFIMKHNTITANAKAYENR
jgi:hypothetical protein